MDEYRTLPMVWYIPPLSPLQAAAQAGKIPSKDGIIPDMDDMRIPVKYLANLLTGGKEAPIRLGLKRMLAMRRYMRSKLVLGKEDNQFIQEVNLSHEQVQDMYHIMAIANYEDRFVIPTGHREESIDAYGETGACGCKPDAKAMEQALAVASGQAQDFDALDALWEDPDVFANNPLNPDTSGDCSGSSRQSEQPVHFHPTLKPQTNAPHPLPAANHGRTL
ncbi:unnamed protein product [Darwinula stevensoni]|uniref:Respiratory nitrate reductase beta C-terminal domain-containing protein n=1 Tax=Darwinula stevensoni TaxID=69355 RepID=A0A7R9A1L1_9CRUS|nr:unnamed protein product [Darwinula stevensoni]CAG0883751.1 unnamed protein product [Darwinula stevensoni]